MPFFGPSSPARTETPVNAADPSFGGIVADGDITNLTGTDNLVALSAASAQADSQNRALAIPAGTYRVSSTFPVPRVLLCDGPGVVTILCTDANVPVAASRNWLTSIGGNPKGRGRIVGIRFCGTGTTGASTNHGLILRDYRTVLQNITIMNCAGDGLHMTHLNQAGVAVASTLVENVIRDIEVRSVAGTPLMLGPSNNNKITDGFVADAYLACQSTSPNALFVGSAAGWQIGEIHTYGTPAGPPIQILNGFRTMMGRLYVEAWLATTNALRIQAQQDVYVEALAGDFPTGGGSAVYVSRSAVYPLQSVYIGSLALRMDTDVACVAVENTSAAISIQVGSIQRLGTFPSRIATQGGTASTDLVRTLSGARTSSARVLVDRGDGVELASAGTGYVTWNGNTAKAIVLPLPPIASFGKKILLVSVMSRSNHNGVSRTKWIGLVHVSAKTNGTDPWVVMTTDLFAASGFTAAPVVTVANTTGNLGELTVSFTAADSDAFGDVSAFVS